MRWNARRCGAAIAAVTSIAVLATSHLNSTQAQECGAPAAHPRRGEAVLLARRINTAQADAFRESKGYQALEMLGVSVPAGFSTQIATDDGGYIFAIKDSHDPCGFSVFSDQRGVIYLAQALR